MTLLLGPSILPEVQVSTEYYWALNMRFRPCIDLHRGVVKQIVGTTLGDGSDPVTHFESNRSPAYFAELYRNDGLDGGHLIMLGPGSDAAAASALDAYPQGLQVGGGMRPDNAGEWLRRGAAAIIVTSYLFKIGRLHHHRLERLLEATGRDQLVIDLSCAKREGRYFAMTRRWQNFTHFEINRTNLELLAACCSEFLIHATDSEGRQQGIATDLVELLGDIAPLPTTYAGGVRSFEDIEQIESLGQGRLDFTVGSALDIFGGKTLHYTDLVAFNRGQAGK